jgi:hypothetical protein
MADIAIQEVTNKGDSFGFSLSKVGSLTADAISEATRYFLVTIPTGAARAVSEIYAALPQKGEAHPEIEDCYVSDISCKVTEDVYVYQAVVNYKWKPASSTDKTLPWLQPASISFSSDSSITQAMDYAYLSLGTTTNLATDATPANIIKLPILAGDGASLTIPIVNEPLKEQPMNLPEEPVSAIAITISASIEGDPSPLDPDSTPNRKHNINQVLELVKCVHTVYGDVTINPDARLPFIVGGYDIDHFCGYLAEVKVDALYYKSEVGATTYAYYKVDITIIHNPQTWVRKVLNLSYNTLSPADVNKHTIEAITVTDGMSTIRSKVDKQQEIHPLTAEPRFIDRDGKLLNTITGQTPNPSYLLYFMTKPINKWAALETFINSLVWVAPV